MARDNTTPLRFMLPDGDNVDLCTWAYIETILANKLGPMIESLQSINSDLTKIDTKLQSWIKTDEE